MSESKGEVGQEVTSHDVTDHEEADHEEAGGKAKATPFPSIPSAASGKLYDWALPCPERPPFLALSPEAMAERTDEATAAIFQASVVRVSALLTVLSNNNGYEGRDRAVIKDDLSCGVVAGMLGIDIDMLQRVLVDLRSRGLVSASDAGELLLSDIPALDRLSESSLGGVARALST